MRSDVIQQRLLLMKPLTTMRTYLLPWLIDTLMRVHHVLSQLIPSYEAFRTYITREFPNIVMDSVHMPPVRGFAIELLVAHRAFVFKILRRHVLDALLQMHFVRGLVLEQQVALDAVRPLCEGTVAQNVRLERPLVVEYFSTVITIVRRFIPSRRVIQQMILQFTGCFEMLITYITRVYIFVFGQAMIVSLLKCTKFQFTSFTHNFLIFMLSPIMFNNIILLVLLVATFDTLVHNIVSTLVFL